MHSADDAEEELHGVAGTTLLREADQADHHPYTRRFQRHMDSPTSPLTPAAQAAALLGSLPTAPRRTENVTTRFSEGLDPEEHDLSDWVAPAGERAPAPSAILEAARARRALPCGALALGHVGLPAPRDR